jgi:hypothetical protein
LKATGLSDLRQQGVHRWIAAIAFEDNGERAGGQRGGFFQEFEDGIGNIVEVIVEEALLAVGGRDEFAAGDVNRCYAFRGDLV